MTESKNKAPRVSKRKRRGHSVEAAQQEAERLAAQKAEAQKPKRAVKAVRQLDPEVFRNVDLMIGSFAQRQYGKLMPRAAQGFFAPLGDQAQAQSQRPALQQAFAMFFVYGYRDTAGLRIVDMFARQNLKLDREQVRCLDACRRAKFVVFALERKNESNRQLMGRDILRGIPMTVLDKAAYGQLAAGDAIGAYMFSVGDMWRPLGMGTKVPRAKSKSLIRDLETVASGLGVPALQLADVRPDQVFWATYRNADATLMATPAPAKKK